MTSRTILPHPSVAVPAPEVWSPRIGTPTCLLAHTYHKLLISESFVFFSSAKAGRAGACPYRCSHHGPKVASDTVSVPVKSWHWHVRCETQVLRYESEERQQSTDLVPSPCILVYGCVWAWSVFGKGFSTSVLQCPHP